MTTQIELVNVPPTPHEWRALRQWVEQGHLLQPPGTLAGLLAAFPVKERHEAAKALWRMVSLALDHCPADAEEGAASEPAEWRPQAGEAVWIVGHVAGAGESGAVVDIPGSCSALVPLGSLRPAEWLK
jgi:hypothetical protein